METEEKKPLAREAEGDFCCRYCRKTELQTLHDLECHRRGGVCHQPTHDPGQKLPFTRKSEALYRLEAEKGNRKNKRREAIDTYW